MYASERFPFMIAGCAITFGLRLGGQCVVISFGLFFISSKSIILLGFVIQISIIAVEKLLQFFIGH